MIVKALAWTLAAAIAGCSPAAPPTSAPAGRIVVAVTIDWEGADASAEGLAALAALRNTLGAVPFTHFVSAGYLTSNRTPAKTIANEIRAGDELAVHLHAWRSLALASGIEPRLSPSFLTGTDELFDLGDVGFEVDPDAYDVASLRAMLRTSSRLLEQQLGAPVSKSFRAGGYLATPKVLLALGAEGYNVDSSAVDPRQLDELDEGMLPKRVAQLWPRVVPTTQPYFVRGQLLEMPIAAIFDYAEPAEVTSVFDAARASLQQQPNRDVFVVLALHLETADLFAQRLITVIAPVRAQVADKLIFTTIAQAAELARISLAPTRS